MANCIGCGQFKFTHKSHHCPKTRGNIIPSASPLVREMYQDPYGLKLGKFPTISTPIVIHDNGKRLIVLSPDGDLFFRPFYGTFHGELITDYSHVLGSFAKFRFRRAVKLALLNASTGGN